MVAGDVCRRRPMLKVWDWSNWYRASVSTMLRSQAKRQGDVVHPMMSPVPGKGGRGLRALDSSARRHRPRGIHYHAALPIPGRHICAVELLPLDEQVAGVKIWMRFPIAASTRS